MALIPPDGAACGSRPKRRCYSRRERSTIAPTCRISNRAWLFTARIIEPCRKNSPRAGRRQAVTRFAAPGRRKSGDVLELVVVDH